MAAFERADVEFAKGWIAVGAMQGKTGPFDAFWNAPGSEPEPCRDCFELRVAEPPESPIIAFAVADGISSELNSDLGAQYAVKAAIEKLWSICQSGPPDQAALEAVFAYAHERVAKASKEWDSPISTFGTTLVVGILNTDDGALCCASVGDGFVVAENGHDVWWFPQAQDIEPTGATYSLTDPDWRKVVNYAWCQFHVSTVVAFTDGLQHVMFEVNRDDPGKVIRNPHRKAIEAIRAAVLQSGNVSRTRNLATLLGMRDDRKLMADDRTLVVLQRLDEHPAANGQHTIAAPKPVQVRRPPVIPVQDHREQDHPLPSGGAVAEGRTRPGVDAIRPPNELAPTTTRADRRISRILVIALLLAGMQALLLAITAENLRRIPPGGSPGITPQQSVNSKGTKDHADARTIILPREIKWAPAPPFFPPGAEMAVLDDSHRDGWFKVRLRFPEGYLIRPFTLPRLQFGTVISGMFRLGEGQTLDRGNERQLPPGSFFIFVPKEPYFAFAEEETVIQLDGSAPWGLVYLNPRDDPRERSR